MTNMEELEAGIKRRSESLAAIWRAIKPALEPGIAEVADDSIVLSDAIGASQAISLKRIADALVAPAMQIGEAIDATPRPSPQTTAREMERVQKHYADRNARIKIVKAAMFETELDVTMWDEGPLHELAEAVVDALPAPQTAPEVAALAAKYLAMDSDAWRSFCDQVGAEHDGKPMHDMLDEIKTLARALAPDETPLQPKET